MKQLRLYTGGHKFHTEDFSHLQEGIVETFTAMAKNGLETSKTVVILDGCVTTGATSSRTWTAGTIYYNNDFYSVPAQGTGVDITASSFDIVETPLAGNPVAYRDGVNRNVHVTNELSFRNDNAGVIQATFLDEAYNYNEQLAKILVEENSTNPLISLLVSNDILQSEWADTEWSDLTIGTNWTEQENCAVIKRGTQALLRGKLESNGSSALVCLSGIPVAMRPSVDRTVPVDMIDVSEGNILARGHVVVKTTGSVEFDPVDYSNWSGGANWAGLDKLVFNNSTYNL